MCGREMTSLARLCAIAILFSVVLSSGRCQNAEPRATLADRSVTRKNDQPEYERHVRDTPDRRFDWEPSSSRETSKSVEENKRTHLYRNGEPETEEADAGTDGNRNDALRPPNGYATPYTPTRTLNDSALGTRAKSVIGERRKKRRRGKQTGRRASSAASEDSENEIRERPRNSRDQQSRKFRAERRRRRKSRERKRARKQNGRSEIGKSRMSDEPSARSNETLIPDPPVEATTRSATTATKSPATTRRPHYEENVEREFSKHLEKEITSSGMLDDPAQLEDRILGSPVMSDTQRRKHDYHDYERRYGPSYNNPYNDRNKLANVRYDAEKMLGYSKTEEDIPILELENEVLARTFKDYNAYMTSSLKLSMMGRRESNDRAPDAPRDKNNNNVPWNPNSSTTDRTNNDRDYPRGDLSCINGTFLPAPLARHVLIKYVKSSVPGHEYLEADYECAPGFYMATSSNRLLCKNRQWIGEVPKCKVKQNADGACAESSCEHVCREVNGEAVCSCYKGFKLDGYKCIDIDECELDNGGCEYKCVNTPGSFRCECPKGMKLDEDRFACSDINECLLNNGHGPCQDTCRNYAGGYECSCEGVPDTILSSDNHTCQDAGPCSVNNAGCSHTCLSTKGRVFCLCPDGFMLEDDWKTCQDVDECAVPDLQTDVCRYGCINMPGTYRCADPPLAALEQPSTDRPSVACPSGYEATLKANCADINECAVDNGGCAEICENTNGSYFCACDGDEKVLSTDGKSCLDINTVTCPPLNPEGRGYLMCSRPATPKPWRGKRRVTNRPGTKCFLKCPRGYQLHGEYELTCRSDGTWDGPKHGECVRYSKPRLECPKDVTAELPPGRDEAFVTFDQPSTDLDWFRYVRSKPSWGTRLEANLKPGLHEVTFFARHPVSKKQTSCVLRIVVKGGEAPKVQNCPDDIEVTGKNGTAIVWSEPIFTDNVKVTRISSNSSPGRRFDVGGHRVEYEASDEAGWSSKCVFTVVLRPE